MPTTKAQRSAACAIIEKFTADDVTFPADFVLALLSDADERDMLAERVRELEARSGASIMLDTRVEEAELRAEAAEAKLAVAVEALEYVADNLIYVDDCERDVMGGVVSSVLSKIKGAP